MIHYTFFISDISQHSIHNIIIYYIHSSCYVYNYTAIYCHKYIRYYAKVRSCFPKVTPVNSPGFSQLVYSLVFILETFTTKVAHCVLQNKWWSGLAFHSSNFLLNSGCNDHDCDKAHFASPVLPFKMVLTFSQWSTMTTRVLLWSDQLEVGRANQLALTYPYAEMVLWLKPSRIRDFQNMADRK